MASCENPAWLDDYHSLRSRADRDSCPTADFQKPLFTIAGALVCPTNDQLALAYNARATNWRYVPLAGIGNPGGAYRGLKVSPDYFGCTIAPDGQPVTVKASTFSSLETELGWLERDEVRNSGAELVGNEKAARAARNEQLRPRLCYPDSARYSEKQRGKCFYTDVNPHQLVPN